MVLEEFSVDLICRCSRAHPATLNTFPSWSRSSRPGFSEATRRFASFLTPKERVISLLLLLLLLFSLSRDPSFLDGLTQFRQVYSSFRLHEIFPLCRFDRSFKNDRIPFPRCLVVKHFGRIHNIEYICDELRRCHLRTYEFISFLRLSLRTLADMKN